MELLPIDYIDPIGESWESVLMQPIKDRAMYSNENNKIQYTRVAQQILGVYTDQQQMQEYLYTLKSLPIGWTLLFEHLPKNIDAEKRTEIINIMQLHKEKPLSMNRLVAFFSGRNLLPLMATEYSHHIVAVFKQWLEDVKPLNRANSQRIFLDLVKWSQHYLPLWHTEGHVPKIMWYGEMKESEACFLYFLYVAGCELVIFHPEGSDELAKYGLAIGTQVKLAQTIPLFDFPFDKPLQVKTQTAQQEAYIRENIYDGANVNYPWKYMHHETRPIFLKTTYYEMQLMHTERMQHREGFHADEQFVYLPVLFGKVEGVNDDIEQYQEMLHKLQQDSRTMLTNKLPLVEPQSANMQFYVKDASTAGELDAEKMIKMPNWPYKQAPLPNQLNIARTIVQLVDMQLLKRLPNERDIDYKGFILGHMLRLPDEVLRLYRQFDYSYESPTFALFVEDGQQVQRSDAVFLLFLVCLGFDVFIFSPGGEVTVEPFLAQSFLMIHRLEKIEFQLQMEELLNKPKVQESTKLSLRTIIQRITRKGF